MQQQHKHDNSGCVWVLGVVWLWVWVCVGVDVSAGVDVGVGCECGVDVGLLVCFFSFAANLLLFFFLLYSVLWSSF